MTAITPKAYKPKRFNLSGLAGISDQTLEMHFALYEGYVKNVNLLTEQLCELFERGGAAPHPAAGGTDPRYAELTRRLAFEYGGMVLHEYYFGNMKRGGAGLPGASSRVAQVVTATFGTLENWMADFKAVGGMRGVGWAVLYQDPATGRATNQWVTLHHQGVPAGFKPLLVMDLWEHAYLLDYKPAERDRYLEAFCQNIDWEAVEQRVAEAAALRPVAA
ncbi:MAG TPA: Fe-Mn family superoxide dismutase [Thermodesulfobacteriota bacterium]|nr:Fe-Mn family superoxide dismutase [Thermodesulfobacteriota bacterium]